jgi:hypothetical protein
MLGIFKKRTKREVHEKKADKLNDKISSALLNMEKPIFNRNETMMIQDRIYKGIYQEEDFVMLNAGLYRLNK